MLSVLSSLKRPAGMYVDEKRGRVWIALADGALGSLSLGGGTFTTAQTTRVRAADISGNGSTLVLAARNGGLWILDPDKPGRAAKPVGNVKARPLQVAVSRRQRPIVLTVAQAARGSRLVRTDTDSGSQEQVRVKRPSGVLILGRDAYVGLNDPTTGTGTLARLRAGRARPVSPDLPTVERIGGARGGLLACHPSIGALSMVDPCDRDGDHRFPGRSAGHPHRRPGPRGRPHRRAHIRDHRYRRQRHRLRPAAVHRAADGAALRRLLDAGASSRSQGPASDPLTYASRCPTARMPGWSRYARRTRLGSRAAARRGGAVGRYPLVLDRGRDGPSRRRPAFEVTDHWYDVDTGPSRMIAGATAMEGGSGWGGGPNTPQNLGDLDAHGYLEHPRPARRYVVRSLAHHSGRDRDGQPDGRPRTGRRRRRPSTGRLARPGTTTRRTRTSWRPLEATRARGLTIAARNDQVFGPVNLPDPWTTYFAQKKDADGNVIDARWSSVGTTIQTIISRALSDGVVTARGPHRGRCPRHRAAFTATPTSAAGDRFVWPHASLGKRRLLLGTNVMTEQGDIAYTYVPLDFAAHDGRQMHTTLSHEVGHNLGLLDVYDIEEYSADVTARITSDWEMMAGSRDRLPHYSISNKMRMGWVPANQLHLYNFQGSGGVNDTITLHPAERADPPAGRYRGIEIRLGDGLNYYVEYRSEQSGLISDDLVTDRRVVVTDVTSEDYVAPLARPRIMFVANDVDGDGPIIGSGSDFEDKDPGTQMDLAVTVVSTAVDQASVRITYGSQGKPEPGIRPWQGGPGWQSPDIEVRNARATAEPAKWFNTPWLGHDNTIVAKVRNAGDLIATGVLVDFFVTEYTTGDGPWVPLGFDRRDVGPGATVEFSRPWNPSSADGRHYCVIVRIRLYQAPGNPAIVDQNIYNNEARSNYTSFISASSSPSTRVGTSVLLANPFSRSTHVFAEVKQTHPQHRVFLEHQWLRVDGKGSRPILVLDEALWGTAEWQYVGERDEKRPGVPVGGPEPGQRRRKRHQALPDRLRLANPDRRRRHPGRRRAHDRHQDRGAETHVHGGSRPLRR